jgi:hypothetical protein
MTIFFVDQNYRYGITISFAKKDGVAVDFEYSIGPMIDPNDPTFYLPFIYVQKGDIVSKGDVIGMFYLPPVGEGSGPHIHFHLNWNNNFYSPSIFKEDVVRDFTQQFNDDPSSTVEDDYYPECIGYKVGSDESIFSTGEQDCF